MSTDLGAMYIIAALPAPFPLTRRLPRSCLVTLIE